MSVEKRTQIPRILEVDELPQFTIESFVEKRDVIGDDLSYIFDTLQREKGQLIGSSSLNSDIYADRTLQQWKDLDFVSRHEVQAHLRAPLQGERPCIRDDECEARNIHGPPEPITLVEHLTPSQKLSKPKDRQMCIMCKRYAMTYMYVQSRSEGTDMSNLFNTHANYVGRHGEYVIEQCLLASSEDTYGVVAPCVAHCRPLYRWAIDPQSGVGYFFEHGYLYPQQQDF